MTLLITIHLVLFYVDLSPLSPTKPLQDMTVSNMTGVLLEAGTAYLSQTPWFTPVIFSGVRVVHPF
jgi:hypothetical protein